jgi:hypothetical protein
LIYRKWTQAMREIAVAVAVFGLFLAQAAAARSGNNAHLILACKIADTAVGKLNNSLDIVIEVEFLHGRLRFNGGPWLPMHYNEKEIQGEGIFISRYTGVAKIGAMSGLCKKSTQPRF